MKRSEVVLVAALLASAAHAGIVDSRHDLSSGSASGGITSTQSEICIFCHTPHGSVPQSPLWNRYDPGSVYLPYTSSTIQAAPGQPDGDSLLCLSCHDGTIALGKVRSRTLDIPMAAGVTTLPPTSPSYLGTDLRDDHPISFEYVPGPELVAPSPTVPNRLDEFNKVQCTTCHDAHDDTNGQFLVMPNNQSALCLVCHQKAGWSASVHKTASGPDAIWNPGDSPPSPNLLRGGTVQEYGCENCHTPHSAAAGVERLLYYPDDANCLACHQAGQGVDAVDVMTEFTKTYRHPQSSATHDPVENVRPSIRHAGCADCHNPHAVADVPMAGAPSGSLNLVRGVDSAGLEVYPVTEEYQLCYRCHADVPVSNPSYPIDRVLDELNTRLEFDLNNVSYHPVEGPGQNPGIVGLVPPLTPSSLIRCTDCHNSDVSSVSDGPAGTGGPGPDGPHGSDYWPILIAYYERNDTMLNINNDAALCVKCHDQNTLLLRGGGDKFDSCHNKHLNDFNISCIMCHDPHGSDYAGLFNPVQGNPGVTSFTQYTPGTGGDSGGNCTMDCHTGSGSKNHSSVTYSDCN